MDQEMEDLSDSSDPETSNGAAASGRGGFAAEPVEDADPTQVSDSSAAEGGYECKYCSFQTPELNLFTLHVDTEHPDVVINTSYVCMECDYHTRRYPLSPDL